MRRRPPPDNPPEGIDQHIVQSLELFASGGIAIARMHPVRMTQHITATCKLGSPHAPLEKLADIARTNPLVLSIRRVIQSTMRAAAGAFGVAPIAAPCYAVAAPDSRTDTLASTTSAPAKQPARAEDAAIRPFRVNIAQAALDDLRKRLLATPWPDKEPVADQSQGAQVAKLQELVQYWGSGYEWRKAEAQLNALPQFTTNIDGLDIHFIHVRSQHKNALPVIISHGWPGSVFEQIKLLGPLTDPTKYGGRAEDAARRSVHCVS
jgi:hypothetical protein